MLQYIGRRLLMTIPVLIGVSLIIFVIMRIAPGDVARMLLTGEDGGEADPVQVERLREELGLNDPYHIQYFDFMSGLVRLDPGTSLWTGRPIMETLGFRMVVTLELAVLAVIVTLVLAIPVGVLSAIYQDGFIDHVFRVVSVGGLAIPNFWLGTLVLLTLARWSGWVPPVGYVSIAEDPWTNIQQLIFPALVLGYTNAAIVSRMTRSAMLEVLREDYVRTAWAKGLALRPVVSRHALTNAILPVLTLAALQLGNLLGGTIIVETIFTVPGVGRFLVDAIYHRDYPVVQTLIMFASFIFVFVNLIVDIMYGWLDPRITYS